jgi:hypothetical protein
VLHARPQPTTRLGERTHEGDQAAHAVVGHHRVSPARMLPLQSPWARITSAQQVGIQTRILRPYGAKGRLARDVRRDFDDRGAVRTSVRVGATGRRFGRLVRLFGGATNDADA